MIIMVYITVNILSLKFIKFNVINFSLLNKVYEYKFKFQKFKLRFKI